MEAQSLLLPLVSLGGVIVGGGLQFLSGRSLESRKQLALQRSQSYVDYFKAVSLLAHGQGNKEALSLAADAKTRICLYGSRDVIEHLRRFDDAGATINSPEAQTVIIGLLKAMRQDVGKDNQAPDAEALRRVLFGKAR